MNTQEKAAKAAAAQLISIMAEALDAGVDIDGRDMLELTGKLTCEISKQFGWSNGPFSKMVVSEFKSQWAEIKIKAAA